jgi:1-acyl-sn-glycerol-3-phosphate acyltransferase
MLLAALRTAIAWLFTAVYLTSLILAYVLCFKRWPDRWIQRGIRFWGKSSLAILGIRVELANTSTIETRTARVLIVNHQSTLDLLWGATIYPPAPLAIGKKEVLWIPLLNLAWWGLDFIRIDRKNRTKALKSLEHVAETVKKGSRTLVIAPEGTRSADGQLLPFKKGAFHIALQAQVPVCPVVVAGAARLMPKHRFVAYPGVIRLKFLEPLHPDDVTEDTLDAWIEGIREKMRVTLMELESHE